MNNTQNPTESPRNLSIRKPPKILIPIAVLEGQTIPEPLVEFIAPANIVVLGYHVLPEQTPTDQASMQYEDRAQAAVEDIAQSFEAVEQTVETRVAFTHDGEKTIERVADEVDATALLLPNPTGPITDILVPIRGEINVDRLVDLVQVLLTNNEYTVTLWGIDTVDQESIQETVNQADQKLREYDIESNLLSVEITDEDAPINAIVERSSEFDIIIMGEGERSLLTRIIGEDIDRVAEGSVSPVIVVRNAD
ncbi:MAG: universal stress protein [Halobacteriaceae archaeon]